MNIDNNLSVAPKKEWIKPEVKGFELSNTESGRYADIVEGGIWYHS